MSSADLIVTINSRSNWGSTGNGRFSVTNGTSQTIKQWHVVLDCIDFRITSMYNCEFEYSNEIGHTTRCSIYGKPYKLDLMPGETIVSDFSYNGLQRLTCTIVFDELEKQPSTKSVIVSKYNWGQGIGQMVVTNATAQPVTQWMTSFTITGAQITEVFNAKLYTNNDVYTIQGANDTAIVAPNTEVAVYFSYYGRSDFTVKYVDTPPTIPPVVPPLPPPVVPPVPPPVPPVVPPVVPNQRKLIGYFAQWDMYGRNYQVSDIPADKLTHVYYAFLLPNPSRADYDLLAKNCSFPPKPYSDTTPEGTLVVHDGYAFDVQMPQLRALKKQHPQLKLGMSIGGWTLSWLFSKVFADPTLRSRFVTSAVDFAVKNGFDVIDIDYEYPGKQGAGYNYVDPVNDAKNMTLMFKELKQLASTKNIEISAALGIDPYILDQFRDSIQYIDIVCAMTYDMYGPWSETVGHLAALHYNRPPTNPGNTEFCGDAAIKHLLTMCPQSKLVFGVPFYARGYAKVIPSDTDPNSMILGKSVNGAAKSYNSDDEGLTSWKDLRALIDSGKFTAFTDSTAVGAYCLNEAGELWSYDNEETMKAKAAYVKANNLAGMMIWQLSDDLPQSDARSLFRALSNELLN